VQDTEDTACTSHVTLDNAGDNTIGSKEVARAFDFSLLQDCPEIQVFVINKSIKYFLKQSRERIDFSYKRDV